LKYLLKYQEDIWADLYNGITNSLLRLEIDIVSIEAAFILPSSNSDDDRFMQKCF
jgi:hypothetical protein